MVSLNYEDSGPRNAPVVVLSGALATTLDIWDEQVADLARHFRVIRFDHRGHGKSPVPPGPYALDDLGADVVELLDDLRLPTASFVGLSLGGMVGMWLAAHFPHRIDRLVVSCASPRVAPDSWVERRETVRGAGTAALVASTMERWFTPEFRLSHESVVSRVAAMVRETPDAGYLACCEAIVAMNSWPLLPLITAPTLVVAASHDQSMPPAQAAAIVEAIRSGGGNSSSATVPDAAHMVCVEQSAAFSALVRKHLLAA